MNRYISINNEKSIKNLCDNIIFHEWNNETYSSNLASCDIAIIPINLESKMASGKPENNQYIYGKWVCPQSLQIQIATNE